MKVSHKWLQTFFRDPLPETKEIANLFTFHTFEIEDIEERNDDNILDVKVLPDRASYCLSHEGIARELSALLSGNKFEERCMDFSESEGSPEVLVDVEEKEACDLYIATKVILDDVLTIPEWIPERLYLLGQKSINPVVDLVNYVMLDVGQPMHVFDASKIEGVIKVRFAKMGEMITTLDGKDVSLDSSVLVIADEKGPLAIAGVKGGKRAEVTKFTKQIIVESAHFDASLVRRTSAKLGIKTDSSKRFENGISKKQALCGMRLFLSLLREHAPDPIVSPLTIAGEPDVAERQVKISHEYLEKALGMPLLVREVLETLARGHIPATADQGDIVVRVPYYRSDLSIPEDIVDEVGRLVGYDKLPDALPNIKAEKVVEKLRYYENKVRAFLISKGFSEVSTYSLASDGEAKIANPLAADKAAVRTEISPKLEEALAKNIYYADLLGLSKVKIFEIGHVYKGGKEFSSLAIGIAYKKAGKGERVNDEIKEVRDSVFSELQAKAEILCTIDDTGGIISKGGKAIGMTNNRDGIMEVDFESLISDLPEPTEYFTLETSKEKTVFVAPSDFPFIVRDIAVFVPGAQGKEGEVVEIIKRHAGDDAVRIAPFDIFEKKNKETGEVEKTSYGYRIVFQAKDKTLTDESVNKIMETISFHMAQKEGWEVR